MFCTQLPCIELNGFKAQGRLIDAQLLSEHYQRQLALNAAAQQADDLLRCAKRKAGSIIRQANHEQRQMRIEFAAEKERLQADILRDCESQWLEKQVRLIGEGEALQQRLIAEVSERIHSSIEKVLTAWFDQQCCPSTLCDRLTKQVVQMASEQTLTLHIHPDLRGKMTQTFGQRLRIVEEQHFNPDRAVLESPQLSVEIDLSRHFRQLLDWLQQSVQSTAE